MYVEKKGRYFVFFWGFFFFKRGEAKFPRAAWTEANGALTRGRRPRGNRAAGNALVYVFLFIFLNFFV